MLGLFIEAMERGLVPDPAIRMGIRKLCRDRLKSFGEATPDRREKQTHTYVEELKRSPLVVHADDANRQHYELPPEFFSLVLGANRKYSSALWSENCQNLNQAETDALNETMARAEIQDGMKILELGCGWGSLTLAMATKFPNSQIVALSNSAPQRLYIEKEASKRGLKNVQIITRNIENVVNLQTEFGFFDRVVSVEMFEHLRNYEMLLERISTWLKPGGKLFVHIFTHKDFSYLFEAEGESNWMGQYFFTGGQMPSHELLTRFQKNLKSEKQWSWNGKHYSLTSEAWLKNQDQNRERIMQIFCEVYGKKHAARWFQRWRVFFLSCAELFGFSGGSEWGVSHYLFKKEGV
jgi:cyclopropane-fatty-acyl-phospholipid synthase